MFDVIIIINIDSFLSLLSISMNVNVNSEIISPHNFATFCDHNLSKANKVFRYLYRNYTVKSLEHIQHKILTFFHHRDDDTKTKQQLKKM